MPTQEKVHETKRRNEPRFNVTRKRYCSSNISHDFSNNKLILGKTEHPLVNMARYDLRKFFFTNRVVNIWNSLPDYVVHADTVNCF